MRSTWRRTACGVTAYGAIQSAGSANVVRSLPAPMMAPFLWCMFAFLVFYIALLIARARLESMKTTLEDAYVALEERASS